MNTINGNNKLERQINKVRKYNGIILVEDSNKYLRIAGVDQDKANRVILTEGKFLRTKYGEKIKIETDFSDLWVNEWNTVQLSAWDNGRELYAVYLDDYNYNKYLGDFKPYQKDVEAAYGAEFMKEAKLSENDLIEASKKAIDEILLINFLDSKVVNLRVKKGGEERN